MMFSKLEKKKKDYAIMQVPVDHMTCGMFQIFHRDECVQLTRLNKCELEHTVFILIMDES